MVKGYLVQDCLIHKNILLFACLTQSLKIYSLKGQSKLVVCYIICYLPNSFLEFFSVTKIHDSIQFSARISKLYIYLFYELVIGVSIVSSILFGTIISKQ